MRAVLCADVHVGNHSVWGGPVERGINTRCRLVLDTLRRAVHRAAAVNAQYLLILGDLVDKWLIEPQILDEIGSIVAEGIIKGITIIVLRGNHDKRSDAAGDTALGVLARAGALIVDKPGIHHGFAFVPHCNGKAAAWLTEACEGFDSTPDALCVHAGVITDATPKFLRESADAVSVELLANLARNLGTKYVFAGNWHDRRIRYVTTDDRVLRTKDLAPLGEKEREELVCVFQLGALVPTGFDNPGVEGYGTVAIFEPDDPFANPVKWEELPGPRFVTAKTKREARKAAERAEVLGHELYLTYEAVESEYDNAKTYVAELVSLGKAKHAEAIPSRSEAAEAVAATGRALRKTATLEEALAVYVQEARFPSQDVDRADVLALCQRLLSDITRAAAVPITVHTIEATNVLRVNAVDIELPSTGVVIIDGMNDSGKTSLCEVISTALWNEVGRGTAPWRRDADGAAKVSITAGSIDLAVSRWRQPSESPGLSYDPGGKGIGTPTETQRSLTKLIGSYDQWRATSVFDAEDDTNTRFGRLTDGDRKKLIEELLGLDFERPLKQCRGEKFLIDKELVKRQTTLGVAQGIVERAGDIVIGYERDIAKYKARTVSVEAAEQALHEANVLLDHTCKQRDDARLRRSSAQAARSRADAALQDVSLKECPECKRPFATDGEHKTRMNKARAALAAAKSEASDAIAAEQIIDDEIAKLERTVAKHRRTYQEAVEAKNEFDNLIRLWDHSNSAFDKAEEEYAAAKESYEESLAKSQLYGAAEQVLGLRGVRVVMVGQLLGMIERGANAWLSRLKLGGSVRLSVGDKGEIPLELEGVGAGYGYRALSRGQKAQVNLSFVRAFAGLHGDEGTLIFDEPFDGLDKAKRPLAAGLVQELAATRCVILISHNEEFLKLISPVRRYTMCDGEVEV